MTPDPKPAAAPSDPNDRNYWPMTAGVSFKTDDLAERERLFARLQDKEDDEQTESGGQSETPH